MIYLKNNDQQNPIYFCLLQIQSLLLKYRSEGEYFQMDHSSEKDYNVLVQICIYMIEKDVGAMTSKNYHMIIAKYNQE